MDIGNLILALALNTRDCIDFLKDNKNHNVSRRLHGAKKNLIRNLLDQFKLIECQRVLQINPKLNPKKSCSECGTPIYTGHCLIKFTFHVMGRNISFHLPLEQAQFSISYTLTTKKVRLLIGTIPAENQSSYTTIEQVEDVIKLLNNMNALNMTGTTEAKPESPRDRYIQKLEQYITEQSPLKLSL
jgi:hypothetical protein